MPGEELPETIGCRHCAVSQAEGIIFISVAQALDQAVVVKPAQPASLNLRIQQINAHDDAARSKRYA